MKGVKFPKFKNDELVEVITYRTGLIDTGKAIKVRLQKQTLLGVEIPKGLEFWVPTSDCYLGRSFSSRPVANIRGWKLNEILKMLVMEGLRHG